MNAVALAVLLLAGRLQDKAEARSETILKQERSIYVPAFQKFHDAEALLNDPVECANRCAELLNDKSIRDIHRDAMLRIQNTDGSYGDWTLFAPYQLRGRAHLARAESLVAGNRKEAAAQARLAVDNLEKSVSQKLKSSEEFLKRAKALSLQLKDAESEGNERLAEAERRLVDLRKLVAEKSAPELVLVRCQAVAADVQGTPYEVEWGLIRETAFQTRWIGFADAGRFRSARASVAALGGFLSEAERKKVLAKIDEKSLDAARRFHAEVRRLLPDQDTWAKFLRFRPDELDARLGVPPADELDPVDRKCRDHVIQMRARTTLLAAPHDEFLQALSLTASTCVESAGRLRDAEDRAFSGLEALMYDLAFGRLKKNLSDAFSEEPEGLGRLRDEAKKILERMEAFAVALDKDPGGRPPVVSKHLEQLRSLVNGLPMDLPRLDEIGRKVLDPSDPEGLWGRTPKLAEKFENELSNLNRSEGARLCRGDRRKLRTYLLTAQVARLLLAGGKTDDLAAKEDLRTIAQELKKDGGPLPEVMNLVSPRVREVLDRLTR